MKSTRSLIGLPIIWESRELGHVSAAVPEDDLRTLKGLFFSSGTGSRFVECSELDLIGDVAVLVHAAGKKSPLSAPCLPRRALSPDGTRLGAITDAFIDEESFSIPLLEFSGGYLDDLANGRTRIGSFSVLNNGDVVIDTPEGGIQS